MTEPTEPTEPTKKLPNIFDAMLKSARHHTSARPLTSALPVGKVIAKPTRPPPSTKPASALLSAHPPTSAKDAEADRIAKWWALHEAGNTDDAERLFGANKGAPYRSGVGGGSRRRRSSHRKRKSYRKSKRVRHTRRKQTRRHRHRRSRHHR